MPVTATGVAAGRSGSGWRARAGWTSGSSGWLVRGCRRVRPGAWGDGEASGGIGSVRRDIGEDADRAGGHPQPAHGGDAYRVSDDQLHRARLVVARNSADPEDLRQLLDMLGLISANPDQPPPVTR